MGILQFLIRRRYLFYNMGIDFPQVKISVQIATGERVDRIPAWSKVILFLIP